MDTLSTLEQHFNIANKNGGFNTVKDAAIVYATLQQAKEDYAKLQEQVKTPSDATDTKQDKKPNLKKS